LISTVQLLLDEVIVHGFRLNPELYRDVLALAGEDQDTGLNADEG
jgi:predicted nucleic acid-binding protein